MSRGALSSKMSAQNAPVRTETTGLCLGSGPSVHLQTIIDNAESQNQCMLVCDQWIDKDIVLAVRLAKLLKRWAPYSPTNGQPNNRWRRKRSLHNDSNEVGVNRQVVFVVDNSDAAQKLLKRLNCWLDRDYFEKKCGLKRDMDVDRASTSEPMMRFTSKAHKNF